MWLAFLTNPGVPGTVYQVSPSTLQSIVTSDIPLHPQTDHSKPETVMTELASIISSDLFIIAIDGFLKYATSSVF
jgi:hypothetical protein